MSDKIGTPLLCFFCFFFNITRAPAVSGTWTTITSEEERRRIGQRSVKEKKGETIKRGNGLHTYVIWKQKKKKMKNPVRRRTKKKRNRRRTGGGADAGGSAEGLLFLTPPPIPHSKNARTIKHIRTWSRTLFFLLGGLVVSEEKKKERRTKLKMKIVMKTSGGWKKKSVVGLLTSSSH